MKKSVALLLGMLWAYMLPAQALTQDEAIRILGREVLKPSLANEEITAWILPQPLTSGVMTPVSRDIPSIDVASALSGEAQWFAFVDLEPCALFEHPCQYVFIDDVSGAVHVYDALDWPALDGEALQEGTAPGERWTHVLPILPREEAVTGAVSLGSAGDYGDAPDGQSAYPGVPGTFPTTGTVVTLAATGERLGSTVSVENGALDAADPDGTPNLVDADADERMFLVRNPNTSPATCALLFDASLPDSALAGVTTYVNVLVDFDRDGSWQSNEALQEWAVMNQTLTLSPGALETFLTPSFPWGTLADEPTLAWARVALTRDRIDPASQGTSGWDGSGIFSFGEIEDAKIYTRPCRGEGCPEGGPPPEEPEEEDPPPFTPCPGPKFGWDGNPIKYFALVVEGVDNAGQTAVTEAADTMQGLLKVQGYQTTHLSGSDATDAKIDAWILDVKSKVACQDRILIYFIAHGRSETPGGQMQLRHKTKTDPGSYTGADLASALAMIPSCDSEACDTPGKCCNVTVIIESCYSGQFVAGLEGEGREIITSSSSTEPSYFGSDGNGGEYSDSYKECADAANADTVDTDDDGTTTPGELHAWAGASLTVPEGKTQTPQHSNMLCDCLCPIIIWDCVRSNHPGAVFFPGQWALAGGENAVSFPEFVEGFEAPEPRYDRIRLEDDLQIPESWDWAVSIPVPGGDFQLGVAIPLPDPMPPISVPLLVPDPEILPLAELNLPILLQVDLLGDQYQLIDSQENLMHQGLWSQYPDNLPQFFQPIDAIRLNQRPHLPLDATFVRLSQQPGGPLLIRWLPAFPGQQTQVDFTMDLTDPLSWTPISGPLDNGGFVVDPEGLLRGFYRVREAGDDVVRGF